MEGADGHSPSASLGGDPHGPVPWQSPGRRPTTALPGMGHRQEERNEPNRNFSGLSWEVVGKRQASPLPTFPARPIRPASLVGGKLQVYGRVGRAEGLQRCRPAPDDSAAGSWHRRGDAPIRCLPSVPLPFRGGPPWSRGGLPDVRRSEWEARLMGAIDASATSACPRKKRRPGGFQANVDKNTRSFPAPAPADRLYGSEQPGIGAAPRAPSPDHGQTNLACGAVVTLHPSGWASSGRGSGAVQSSYGKKYSAGSGLRVTSSAKGS